MRLDNSQIKFCKSNENFIRLLAPAGSGKTLSLLWRCRYLFELSNGKPCRFLIFTFTRVAKDELKYRLLHDTEFVNIKSSVRVDTLNQWGYNYLKKNIESSLEVKASKVDKFFLIKNILRPIWKKHPYICEKLQSQQFKYSQVIEIFDSLKSAGFRHDSSNFYYDFETHILWLKENNLGRYFESKIVEPIVNLELFNSNSNNLIDKVKPFLDFWKESCNHLWNSSLISLDDQKYWALIKLQEKYGNNAFPEPNRYHHIMIDEFQDINPLDLFLIKTLQNVNRSSLVLVGDEDQAIFEWRGSTPTFILNPDKYFNSDLNSHNLEINYRSPKNIVEYSQNLIKYNKNRINKTVIANSKTSADINIKVFPTHVDSIKYIMDIVYDANKRGEPKKVAIIGRKKSQIIPLQIILTSENIPYYAKEDLNILLSKTFEELKEILISIATKQQRRYSKDVVNSFLCCCNKVQTYPLKSYEKNNIFKFLLSKQPNSFIDALKYFQEYNGPLRGSTDECIKFEYLVSIAKILKCKTVSEAIDEISQQFRGLQQHYAKSEDDIFYKDPPFLYLAEYAKRYNNDFFKFIDHVEKAITMIGAKYEIDDDIIDSEINYPIHLMTALRAKGKEYETVILLDVNDGIWPSKFAETESEIEQERRIFYVAVTRPRNRLIILTVESILSKIVKPSPFIKEMGLSI